MTSQCIFQDEQPKVIHNLSTKKTLITWLNDLRINIREYKGSGGRTPRLRPKPYRW